MSMLNIDTLLTGTIPAPKYFPVGHDNGLSPRTALRLENGRRDRRLMSLRMTQMVRNRTILVQEPRDYYSKLPFKPGIDMMDLLGPIGSKKAQHSTTRPAPKKLDVRIAPTVLVNGEYKVLVRNCNRTNVIVRKELHGVEWMKRVAAEWRKKAEQHAVPEISAVMKQSTWGSEMDQKTEVVEAKLLAERFRESPEQCVLQQYIKSRGARASVYRVVYARNRNLLAFNLVNNSTIPSPTQNQQEAQLRPSHGEGWQDHHASGMQQQHSTFDGNSEFHTGHVIPGSPKRGNSDRLNDVLLASTTTNGEDLSVFEISGRAIASLSKVMDRTVSHLELNISATHSIPGIRFEKLIVDFVKCERKQGQACEKEWCLLQVKSFLLTPESYQNAVKLNEAVAVQREACGDFYDSDEEEQLIKKVTEELSIARPKIPYSAQQRHTSVMQHCKLCYRWWRKKHPNANRKKMNAYDKENFFDTSHLANTSAEKSALERQGRPHTEGITQTSRELSTGILRLKLERDRNQTILPAWDEEVASPTNTPSWAPKPQTKRKKQDAPDFVSWPTIDVHVEEQLTRDRNKNAYSMTYRMAYELREQLRLRGHLKRTGEHGLLFSGLPLGSDLELEDMEIFPQEAEGIGHFEICECCYKLWVANEKCLAIGEACGLLYLPMKLPTVTRLPGVRENSEVIEETKKLVQTKEEQLLKQQRLQQANDKSKLGNNQDGTIPQSGEVRMSGVCTMNRTARTPNILKKPLTSVGELRKQEVVRYSVENDADFGQVKEQHRICLFFKEINDLPKFVLSKYVACMNCTYRFLPTVKHAEFPVNMENRRYPTKHSKSLVIDLKQLKLHYFLACNADLQGMFAQAQIPIEFEAILRTPSRVHECGTKDIKVKFHGTLFLTKFLNSRKRLAKGCLHEVSVRLVCDHTEEELSGKLRLQEENLFEEPKTSKTSETSRGTLRKLLPDKPPISMVVKMAVGIIRDTNVNASILEPGITLFPGVGGALHFPHNYFDFRPIPSDWMDTVVIKYSRTKYIQTHETEELNVKQGLLEPETVDMQQARKASLEKKGITAASFRVESYSFKGLVRTPSFHKWKEGQPDPDEVERNGNQHHVVTTQVQTAITNRRMDMAKVMNDVSGEWWEELHDIFDALQSASVPEQENGANGSSSPDSMKMSHVGQRYVSRREFFNVILERAHEQFQREVEDGNQLRSFKQRRSIQEHSTDPEKGKVVDYVTLLPLIHGPIDTEAENKRRSRNSEEWRNKDVCTWKEISDHIWLKIKDLVKKEAKKPGTPQAKKLASGYAIGPGGGNEGLVFALGVFSQESKALAVRQRRWRMRLCQQMWGEVDIDKSGAVDLAEFRSYIKLQTQGIVKERKSSLSAKPGFAGSQIKRPTLLDTLAKKKKFQKMTTEKKVDLESLTQQEIQEYMCDWLSSSKSLRTMFDRYDKDASGRIEWREFFDLVEEALSSITSDDVSFARSELLGNCSRHPLSKIFTIDRACVECEIMAFDPRIKDIPARIVKQTPEERAKFLLQNANMVKRSKHIDIEKLEQSIRETSASIGLVGLSKGKFNKSTVDTVLEISDDSDTEQESVPSPSPKFRRTSRSSLVANLRWAAIRQFGPGDELVLRQRSVRRRNSLSGPRVDHETEMRLSRSAVKDLASQLPKPMSLKKEEMQSKHDITYDAEGGKEDSENKAHEIEEQTSLDHFEAEEGEEAKGAEDCPVSPKRLKSKKSKKRIFRKRVKKKEELKSHKQVANAASDAQTVPIPKEPTKVKSKIINKEIRSPKQRNKKSQTRKKCDKPEKQKGSGKVVNGLKYRQKPWAMKRKGQVKRRPLSAGLVMQQQKHRQILQRWGESYLLRSLSGGDDKPSKGAVQRLRADVDRSVLFSRVQLGDEIRKKLGTVNDRREDVDLMLRDLETGATLSSDEAVQAFQEGSTIETLFRCVLNGETEEAHKLLSRHSPVAAERLTRLMYQGTTLLHFALMNGQLSFCKMIISEYHVDPSTVLDSNKLSAKELAERSGVHKLLG